MKQIKIIGGNVADAMKQVEAQDALTIKERNCLRLLTEEMFSAVKELVGTLEMDYTLAWEGKKYVLTASTKAALDLAVREQLLTMSSTGKNAANKGLKGFLGAVVDVLFEPGSMSPMMYGLQESEAGMAGYWSLAQFMNAAPQEELTKEWDGMERSIIANFADDVAVGVRSGRLEIQVIKSF